MRFLFSIKEGFKIALHALRSNKVRSFLTTLCIIIGITMVTVVDTVTTGMDEVFDNSMDMLGTNVVYVEKWPWDGGDLEWWEIINRREMKLEYVEQIEEYSRLASTVTAAANNNVSVRYGKNEARMVGINGATSNYLSLQGLDIVEGRMFIESEVRSASKVAVIGQTLQTALFGQDNPIGKQVRIGGQKFTVIGVLSKQGNFLGLGDADNRVIVPITAYGNVYGLKSNIQIGVQFPNDEVQVDGEYELEGVMRRIRGLDAKEQNDFFINKPQAFEEQLNGIKNGLYFGGYGLMFLSLLIGGIGVMNIMFVSVRERTKEIGIRKAVGAKSWEILTQFLIEAVVICFIGGIFGIVLAGIATIAINEIFIAKMNVDVVLLAFTICTLVGVTFGFIPAYKAATADPIDSLRFD